MSTIIKNEDIEKVSLAVPEGHKHLRATIYLKDGREIVLQEATLANLTRAYVTLKTHPIKSSLELVNKRVSPEERKEGYGEWQLLESLIPHDPRNI